MKIPREQGHGHLLIILPPIGLRVIRRYSNLEKYFFKKYIMRTKISSPTWTSLSEVELGKRFARRSWEIKVLGTFKSYCPHRVACDKEIFKF